MVDNNIHKLDNHIIKCLYCCIAALGGQSDILSAVGSWKDSLPSEEVLGALEAWLEETLIEKNDSELIEFCRKSYTWFYHSDYKDFS